MGYQFSKQVSFVSFPFTFCFVGVNPNQHPFIGMWPMWLILDDPNVWVQIYDPLHEVLFKKVMPMAMENLTIAQH
jgi:hypothetical protein